ncbi:hypothetical protein [Paraburkholderia phenoliruptrix]|uniref:hypothetical protein n=1 Tax=Paraburkholderia phenoliruptrix TaxID=252970 RepID=UPI0028698DE1|nr:hypothetical protein [Paraburkholderia phenoliruptrix]WMY11793.1 hypothetical protein P3F88_20495 [Paraburkholderia phenoliruptrix]
MPLPGPYVRELSLAPHIAFDAFRRGEGNRALLYSLIRTTYLSYLLWSEGIGSGEYAMFCRAESGLERAAQTAEMEGRWQLEDDSVIAIAHVLQMYDGQIGSVSLQTYADCRKKLEHLLRVDIPQRGKALFEGDAQT